MLSEGPGEVLRRGGRGSSEDGAKSFGGALGAFGRPDALLRRAIATGPKSLSRSFGGHEASFGRANPVLARMSGCHGFGASPLAIEGNAPLGRRLGCPGASKAREGSTKISENIFGGVTDPDRGSVGSLVCRPQLKRLPERSDSRGAPSRNAAKPFRGSPNQ